MQRTTPSGRPTVLVVGSGFAGFHCMRRLEKHLPPDAAELLLASSADYLLYSPLLPNVAAGVVEPRHIAVGLHAALRRAKVLLGHVVAVDVGGHTATLRRPDGSDHELAWDRLVLAPGGVSRTFNIPGVAEHGLGLKTLAEAAYLRDHVLRELDNADAADDPARRRACCTFVVVGAGYSGTETAAQMQLVTSRAAAEYPRLRPGGACAGCWSTWPPGCCRSWAAGWATTPWRCCAAAGSRSGWARPSRRRPPTGCGCRTARRSRPTPWSGAPASPRAR